MAKVFLTDIALDGRTQIPIEVLECLGLGCRGSLAWSIDGAQVVVSAGDMPCPAYSEEAFWQGIMQAFDDMRAGRLAGVEELEEALSSRWDDE